MRGGIKMICPIMSEGAPMFVACQREKCPWYDHVFEWCVVLIIAKDLHRLIEKAEEGETHED